MDKINFANGQAGGTPLNANNLNLLQDNVEEAIIDYTPVEIYSGSASATTGTTTETIKNFYYILLVANESNFNYRSTIIVPTAIAEQTNLEVNLHFEANYETYPIRTVISGGGNNLTFSRALNSMYIYKIYGIGRKINS